jgi:hypothetical protein
LGASPLKATAALTGLSLGELQLAVEGVDLRRNVEDAGVSLVVMGDLHHQKKR